MTTAKHPTTGRYIPMRTSAQHSAELSQQLQQEADHPTAPTPAPTLVVPSIGPVLQSLGDGQQLPDPGIVVPVVMTPGVPHP